MNTWMPSDIADGSLMFQTLVEYAGGGLFSLQGFTSNATPHDCNTTNLVAIGGLYYNLCVKWLQSVPVMQWTKCVAICVVCHCNRCVLLQLFWSYVAISWHYCHGALELY